MDCKMAVAVGSKKKKSSLPALQPDCQVGPGPGPWHDAVQHSLGHHPCRRVMHLCKRHRDLQTSRQLSFKSGTGLLEILVLFTEQQSPVQHSHSHAEKMLYIIRRTTLPGAAGEQANSSQCFREADVEIYLPRPFDLPRLRRCCTAATAVGYTIFLGGMGVRLAWR